jgi:hypothetical protein
MDPIEVIMFVASIRFQGEQWEAWAYFEAPRERHGWLDMRRKVNSSLGQLLADNELFGLGGKVKLRAQSLVLKGLEAKAMRVRMSDTKPYDQDRWQLVPVAEVRFTLKGQVKLG